MIPTPVVPTILISLLKAQRKIRPSTPPAPHVNHSTILAPTSTQQDPPSSFHSLRQSPVALLTQYLSKHSTTSSSLTPTHPRQWPRLSPATCLPHHHLTHTTRDISSAASPATAVAVVVLTTVVSVVKVVINQRHKRPLEEGSNTTSPPVLLITSTTDGTSSWLAGWLPSITGCMSDCLSPQ